MSECSKYRELICSLVDEELNTQTREALLSHIEGCGAVSYTHLTLPTKA